MELTDRIARTGLNNRQLAEVTGLNLVTIWRYRQGKRVPSVEDAAKLAPALGCTVAEIRPDLAKLIGATP